MMDRWLQGKRPRLGMLNGHDRPEVSHLVDVRQVVKRYESAAGAFTALKGVNLQINPGEFVAVVGKSGSGKSTLLNIVAGIDHPTSGEVIVGDTAVHLLRERQIAPWRGRTIGVIFQFFQLLPTLTVIENVMLPMDFCHAFMPRERRGRALRLLELVDLAEHAHKLPTALSGGQQQRVAIARALANDPPILLADEPTGNLDSRTAEAVFRLFMDLVDTGKTILMVTHDADLARQVTRAIILGDGEVIDQVVNQRTPVVGAD
jgi:putative ABC transport system ATP-binding protein